MSDLEAFAQALGLPAEPVAEALRQTRRTLPWYAELVAAVGGWLAAIILTAAIGPLVFDDDHTMGAGIFGLLLIIGGGIGHRRLQGAFGRQFTLALILAGQTVVLIAAGMESDGVTVPAVVAVLLALVLIPLVRDRIHQFLTVAAAAGLVLIALAVNEIPQAMPLAALLTVPSGVALLLHPPRFADTTPAALVLLLVAPLCDAVAGMVGNEMVMLSTGWGGRLAYVAGLAWPLLLLWPAATARGRLLAGGALAVGVVAALTFPAGLVAGLLFLALAYTIGSRLLAGLGVAVEIFFMTRFYYDLGLDLLHKSMLLALIGAMLLGLWLAWRRVLPDAEDGR